MNSAQVHIFEHVRELITSMRSIRAAYRIAPMQTVRISVVAKNASFLENTQRIIQKLARVDTLTILPRAEKMSHCVSTVKGDLKVFVDLEGIMDVEKEKKRIEKELLQGERYMKELKKRLKSKEFLSKAPGSVVKSERENLKRISAQCKKLTLHLHSIQK